MAMEKSEFTIGQEFTGKPKKVSWERLWTFSGGPFNNNEWPKKNLHTDVEAANNVGLERVAASGTQYQGYLIELLIEIFGEKWLSYGSMKIKFPAIVADGDSILSKVKVIAKEGNGNTVKHFLEVWCENQAGEKVLVGTAIA